MSKHKVKLSIRVTSQTLYNLHRLADMSGVSSIGHVVDKLVRAKMLELKGREDRKHDNS